MAKNLNRKVTIYINGKEVENTIKSLQGELRRLQREQKTLTIGSDEYVKHARSMREIEVILRDQQTAVRQIGDAWQGTSAEMAKYATILTGARNALQMLGRAGQWVERQTEAARKMDDAYGLVQKTTMLTHDETLKLNEAFKQMDTRTSREQLNQLAYEAGKLGVTTGKAGQEAVDAVAGFVRASDEINTALGDVLGDGAMVQIGKLADIYQQTTEQMSGKTLEERMRSIGAAVNQLGKESTANEAYMVDFLYRLGGIATQAKLSAADILGYASALDQSGQKVEMAATAMQKLIQQMVKKPEEFVQAAGVSLGEFRRMMDEDMNGTIQRVLRGMQEQGGFQQLIGMFHDMGLDGARAAAVVSSLAANLDKVAAAQSTANEQLQVADSMQKEYATMQGTLEAQAEKRKKRLEDAREQLGNELYPALVAVQGGAVKLMGGAAGLLQLLKEYPGIVGALVAALAAWQRAKLLHIASTARQTAAEWAKTAAQKASRAVTLQATMAEKAAAAAKERLRLAELKATLQRAKHTAATKAFTYELGGMRVTTDAATARLRLSNEVERQATVAKNAHTAATKAGNLAMKATPWGAVIAGASAVIALFVKLKHSTNEWKLDQTMKEAAKQTGEAEGRLKVLKRRLEGAAVGSEAYKKALSELKAEYPDVMRLHVDETGNVRDLERAYKDLAEAARKSVYERMYADKAGELQGELGETLQKSMKGSSRFIDRTFKELSEAERTEMKREANSILVALSQGEKDYAEAYKEYKALFDGADGGNGRQWGNLPWINDLYNKAVKTDQALKSLEANLHPDGADPFGVQKMSLEELEAELRKYLDMMEHGFSEGEARDAARLKAYRDQIAKLRAQQAAETASAGAGGGSPTSPDRTTEKWASAHKAALGLIADFEAKEKSGIARIEADINKRVAAMVERIEAAEGATAEMKEEVKKDLYKAADNLRNAKVQEYLDQAAKKVNQLKASMNSTQENKYVAEAENALERLRLEFGKIDDAIATLSLNRENATETEKEQIDGLIAKYRELKGVMVGNVLGAVGEVQPVGTLTSHRSSEAWSAGVKGKVKEKRESFGGIFGGFDQSALEAYGNELQQIVEKREKIEKQLKSERDGEFALIDGLKQEVQQREDELARTTDPERQAALQGEITSLTTQIGLHEEKADKLGQQLLGLDKLQAKEEEVAASNALGDAIDRWIKGLEAFGNAATEIWGNVNAILDNQGERERIAAEKRKDEAIKNLDEQLEAGLVSQEEYTERKQELEDEYDEHAKQIALEQWKRQKALQLGQAVIESALAVLKAWNAAPWPANAVPIALATAMGAMQIAAIASEPEPYARGGYVPRRTVYQAGEAGEEWVASNSLLHDPATAPLIAALEQYQRGGRLEIPMAQLNEPIAMQAARTIASRQVAVRELPPQTPSAWERASSATGQTGADEMVSLMRDLAAYLRDPRNRQAVISRRTMQDFDREEEFLRSRARL